MPIRVVRICSPCPSSALFEESRISGQLHRRFLLVPTIDPLPKLAADVGAERDGPLLLMITIMLYVEDTEVKTEL